MVGFGQSAFTVVAPVPKENVAPLKALLERVGVNARARRQEPGVLSFEGVEGLHMASMVLIPLGDRTALMFEGNLDGEVVAFFDRLVQARADDLGKIFDLCEGYHRDAAAAFLKAHDAGINTFFVGCPGRTLVQIRQEAAMRKAMESHLGLGPSSDDLKTFARAMPGTGPYERPFLVRYGGLLLGVAVGGVVLLFLVVFFGLWRGVSPIAAWVFVVLLTLLAGGAVAYLRFLETRDVPAKNDRYFQPNFEACLDHEDYGISNHFCSITEIKPGVFRAILLRGVLGAIHWLGILKENQGLLSGIPSIHFARWTILEGRWLLFLSNFDGSWESYLNDFIDKGHGGLTGVWSNTVGFPPAEFLVGKGATHEAQFKIYARNSQSPTLVWYRAYDDLTTKNIENNTRIREGLHTTMTNEEDARWRIRL